MPKELKEKSAAKSKVAAEAAPKVEKGKDKAALKAMSFAEGESTLAPQGAEQGDLKKGSKGPRVVALQKALQRIAKSGAMGDKSLVPYFKAAFGVDADGEYGAATERAVIELQRNAMLPMDGVYEEGTAAALDEVIAALDQYAPEKPGKAEKQAKK